MPSDDFRFLEGHFLVQHQRLTERLTESDQWSFETQLWGQSVMGGAAFLDQMEGTLGEREFWGLTLRLHDPVSDEWRLYWADTWHGGLRPPLVGRFRDAVGEFFGEDEEGGVPVRVRFRWSAITATTARWEQAFSVNAGATWETNWIMDCERVSGDIHPHGKAAAHALGAGGLGRWRPASRRSHGRLVSILGASAASVGPLAVAERPVN